MSYMKTNFRWIRDFLLNENHKSTKRKIQGNIFITLEKGKPFLVDGQVRQQKILQIWSEKNLSSYRTKGQNDMKN